MRILFIGCVKSSEIFLKKLMELQVDIVGVVTKSESKFNADFVDIGKMCIDNKIDYIYVKNVNDIESKVYIKEKNPDIIMCLGWSQILDKEILSIPTMGCVGFHPAQLPYNRGRHPLIWALVLGLESTASTLFLMDSSADTGEIISQQIVQIDYNDDAASLYEKVMETATDQLEKLVHELSYGIVKRIPQNIVQGNAWRKRGKNDGEIDWRMSSRSIYNLVRALTKPYVGAHFIYQNQEYKVWKVKEIITHDFDNIEPGKVLKVDSQNKFQVKAGENVIEVLSCDLINIQAGEYL